jgi:hypothetical protein
MTVVYAYWVQVETLEPGGVGNSADAEEMGYVFHYVSGVVLQVGKKYSEEG